MATIKSTAKSKLAAKDALLRDVYSYFDLGGQMIEANDPGMAHGGESGMGTGAVGFEWADQGNQAENQNASPVQFNAPEALAHAVTWGQQYGGDGTRGAFSVDPTKLPETRFGSVLNTHRVDPSTDLFNPNLVYDDPNYGNITLAQNIDTRSWSDYFGPAIMAAATWGMGALGAPALGTGLVTAGRAFGEGGLRGGADDILGLIANQFGVPSWLTALGRYGVNELLDGKEKTDMPANKMMNKPRAKWEEDFGLFGDPIFDIPSFDFPIPGGEGGGGGDGGYFPAPGGEGGGGGDGSYFPAPGGEGGGGGDGITVGGPPSGGPNIGGVPWSQIARFFGIGGNGSGSGSGSGNNGEVTLQSLLPLLSLFAGGYGAFSGNQATGEATDAALRANQQATDFVRERMGVNDSIYQPYTNAGRDATASLSAMGPRPLAGNYQPLGSGRWKTVGQTARGR